MSKPEVFNAVAGFMKSRKTGQPRRLAGKREAASNVAAFNYPIRQNSHLFTVEITAVENPTIDNSFENNHLQNTSRKPATKDISNNRGLGRRRYEGK